LCNKAIKNVHTYGKVGAIDHGAVVFGDDPHHFVFLFTPAGGSFNQGHCGERTRRRAFDDSRAY
jgi:hypothetical protein